MNSSKAETQVLWVSPEAGQKSLPDISGVEWLKALSWEDGLKIVEKHNCAAVIGTEKPETFDAIAFLEAVREKAPNMIRLVQLERVNETLIKQAVNQASVLRVLEVDDPQEEIKNAVLTAVDYHENLVGQQSLIQEIKNQNSQLEELTEGLDHIVKERTQSAAESKRQVEKKVAQARSLTRFVKDLSGVMALEELLTLLRKEFKNFHKVADPLLAWVQRNTRPRILYMRGSQVYEKQVKNFWPVSSENRVDEWRDSQYLADEFGRPFRKVIAFPLMNELGDDEDKLRGVQATLFFEHSLPEETVERFIEHVSERLQPVSIALDRILLEKELRNASYMWEQTFDGIGEPIAVLDVDYQLLRSNRHFSERVKDGYCYENFKKIEQPCSGCPVEEAFQAVAPRSGQVRRGERLYEVHSYPIVLNSARSATTLVNHYVDVTRAHELQGRMIQNEKMAAIGHLANNIAHELNNPLTGIRSLAQVLLHQTSPDDRIYEDIREVEAAAERSQIIIDNLLEFARGGVEQKVQNCDLNDIVERTLPLLKTAMRDYTRILSLSEAPLPIYVEPQLIQQVVFNIVNNSCQAMGEQGQVRIETKAKGDRAILEIGDTGPGMSAEVKESVFDPFFTTKSAGKGTGLGLSMSREVIRRFGGDIFLDTEMGQGTCVTVELPVANEVESADSGG